MKRKIYSQVSYIPGPGEFNDGPRITDATGYIPVQKMIYDMLTAGQTLQVLRNAYYEDEAGNSFGREDDMSIDPTTRRGFSTADADQLSRILSEAGDRTSRFADIKKRTIQTLRDYEQNQMVIDNQNVLTDEKTVSEQETDVKAST